MNSDCEKIKDQIADLVTGILSSEKTKQLQQHLDECSACRDYVHALKDEDTMLTQLFEEINTDMIKRQERVLQAIDSSCADGSIETFSIRNIIMKSPITKLAAAAVIIVAIAIAANFMNLSTTTVSAQEVLSKATKAIGNLRSVYIKARMRTLPRDNFAYIGLELDFVPIEMWKRTDDTGLVQWRIDKPGRLVLMDGESTTLYIKSGFAAKSGPSPDRYSYDSYWCGHILDVDKLLENELNKVIQNEDAELHMADVKEIDGSDVLVVDITVPTNVGKDDYLRNKFVSDSDHRRVYCFDVETNLLKSFEIYVITDKGEVKIFETTSIEYNPSIDDSVFTLELPNNVVWNKEPEILPDNDKYENMTPKEAATEFFNACAQEKWDEYLKFHAQSHVSQKIKDILGGIEVISIGEPFQSGNYPGWFVPYEIKLRNGYIKKHNLAIRKDNPSNRWQFDGGI